MGGGIRGGGIGHGDCSKTLKTYPKRNPISFCSHLALQYALDDEELHFPRIDVLGPSPPK